MPADANVGLGRPDEGAGPSSPTDPGGAVDPAEGGSMLFDSRKRKPSPAPGLTRHDCRDLDHVFPTVFPSDGPINLGDDHG